MSPPAASAKITLTYPLYAADFDPQNSDFLLVGGGGGEGRSGVGNKIVRTLCTLANLLLLTLDFFLIRHSSTHQRSTNCRKSSRSISRKTKIQSHRSHLRNRPNNGLRLSQASIPPPKSSERARMSTYGLSCWSTQYVGRLAPRIWIQPLRRVVILRDIPKH